MDFFVFVLNLYSVELVIDMQQEILIDKGLEFLMGMLFFSFLHSYRGIYFHSHNFSITVKSFFRP